MRAKVLALVAFQALARLEAQSKLLQVAAARQGARALPEALAAGGGGAAQVAQAVWAVWAMQLRAAVAAPAKERRERAQRAAEQALVAMQLTAASRTWPASWRPHPAQVMPTRTA
jgi:hypothetical protein